MVNATRLAFHDVNAAGGINGHPVEVGPYDDQGNPQIAVEKAKEIAASPAVAVIGHFSSATAVAAGPIYRQAQLPALTASASAPGVTANNPFYFRVTSDTSSQGHLMAAYADRVLGKPRASILYSNEDYGPSLRAAFADEYAEQGGTLDKQWAWDPHASPEEHAAFTRRVSEDIANGQGEVVVLAISPFSAAKEAMLQLRRTGVNPVILGGTSLGNNFAQQFVNEPEEKRDPGFFTVNTYIASPIIYDSASDRALASKDRFNSVYHSSASERAASNYDAALLVAEALRESSVQLNAKSRDADRIDVRNWLAAQITPQPHGSGSPGRSTSMPLSRCRSR